MDQMGIHCIALITALYDVWLSYQASLNIYNIKYLLNLLIVINVLFSWITCNLSRRTHYFTYTVQYLFWLLSFISLNIHVYGLVKEFYIKNNLFWWINKRVINNIILYVVCFEEIRSISEYEPPHKHSKTDSAPELGASLPSRIRFKWINKVIYGPNEKSVEDQKRFSLSALESVQHNSNKFSVRWKEEIMRVKRLYKDSTDEDTFPGLKTEEDDPTPFIVSEVRSTQGYEETRTPLQEDKCLPSLRPRPARAHPSTREVKPTPHRPLPSLIWTLFSMHKKLLFKSWCFRFLYDSSSYANPFLLRRLLQYTSDLSEPDWHGYLYALAFFLVGSFGAVCRSQSGFMGTKLSLRCKSSLVPAIFSKALKMNPNERGKSVGQVVNLISVDAEGLAEVIPQLWVLWSTTLQICLSVFLLWWELGNAIFVGLLTLLVIFPFNAYVVNVVHGYESQEMDMKDDRISHLSETVNGIKTIKLYAWEQFLERKINRIRLRELYFTKMIAFCWAYVVVLWDMTPFIVMFATFTAYVYTSKEMLTTQKAFVSLSLFNMLRFPMLTLPWGIASCVNGSVAVKRIRNFLLEREINPNATTKLPYPKVNKKKSPPSIEVDDATFSWKKSGPPIIFDINFDIRQGRMLGVVGRSGVGKTTLLLGMLNEINICKGSVTLRGEVAYVPQSPWLENVTFQENILFGRDLDPVFYARVLEACGLTADLATFPAGDKTEIGERGSNLSGGQKQRISLARAVYQLKDIYLLDDTLSAVDPTVGRHIFNSVLGPQGLLANKTRVLVTHGIHWLPMMHEVLVLDETGHITERGSYQTLLESEGGFADFLRSFLPESEKRKGDWEGEGGSKPSEYDMGDEDDWRNKDVVTSSDGEESASGKMTTEMKMRMTRSMTKKRRRGKAVRNQSNESDDVGPEVAMKRVSPTRSKYNGARRKKRERAIDILRRLRELNIEPGTTPVDASATSWNDPQEKASDASNSNNKLPRQRKRRRPPHSDFVDTNQSNNEMAGSRIIEDEMTYHGRVSWYTYKRYIRARGYLWSFIMLVGFAAFSITQIGSCVWLQRFVEDPILHPKLGNESATSIIETRKLTDKYMSGYGLLCLAEMVFLFIFATYLARSNIEASKNLHRRMLFGTMRAPMSFFDTTTVGRLINRFARDMETVDHSLAGAINDLIGCTGVVICSFIVICYSTPYFLVLVFPLFGVYYFIQNVYLPIARQSRRMDSVTRSPIFSHFSSSILGISVIRSFGQQTRYQDEFDVKVDANSRYYLLKCVSNQWLAVRLEELGACVVFMASIFAVLQRGHLSPGLVGLSLTYALQVTENLNWLVRQTAELETNAVALERIFQYSDVIPEAAWEIRKSLPANDWPNKGHVVFENYSTRYRVGLQLVLKEVNIEIVAGSKIGIVGRSGAGKSSLMMALFRLVEAVEGRILVDGVNIAHLGLHQLRFRFNVLPQDPIVFSGTLRNNLDPSAQFSDVILWNALTQAHLGPWARRLPHGLDYQCGNMGANVSVGQRQLICLARLFLHKSKILLLDEATAAVDITTGRMIMRTIQRHFSEATVFIIAHKITTVLDVDKLMVLTDGKIVEFDSPTNLLANKKSYFSEMFRDAELK